MKKHLYILGYLLTFIFPALAQTSNSEFLLINEIQVCNTDLLVDPSYNYGAWVELYNSGSESISLAGHYITNDENEPKKFQIPSSVGSVGAGSYLVLWFDHNKADGNFGGKSSNQVRFKLDTEGGTVYIFDSKGNKICQADYPPGIARCSYARTSDGGKTWRTTGEPTPGATNSTSTFADMRIAAPEIEVEGGVFNPGETITFTVKTPVGAKLAYTTDGSTPTLTNGKRSSKSTNTFTVTETTVYRFATYKSGYLPSPVLTRSFIYKNHDYYLPIVSVTTDPKNLFDDNLGIYCSGTNGISGRGQSQPKNWNMDWERPVNMEYMVPETNTEGETSFITYINQEVDMEVCGGWSRGYGGGKTDGKNWEAKPSFRLKCDKEYEGQNSLDYPVFPLKPYNKYKVWQIRNGGNDTYARITDVGVSQIALRSDFNIDAQDCQPAHIFFNGQYLGMLNIRESNNRHYGYSNQGIDTDDMDQFELSGGFKMMVGTDEAWTQLVNDAKQLSKDLSEESYNKVCELLDVNEFINYMAYCTYLGPSDWFDNANNLKAYRSRSDGGKYRFVLFDMDSSFSSDNMISKMMKNNFGSNVDDVFRYLMAYMPFRKKFVDAYCLIDGSIFAPDRCEQIIQELYEQRNTALSFEGNSSNTDVARKARDMHNGSRLSNLQSALNLDLPYNINLTSNIEEARLMVNEQIIPTGKFEGNLYPVDGSIQLTAQAPAGYTFTRWTIEGTQQGIPGIVENLIAYDDVWEYYDQGSQDGKDWKSGEFDAIANEWKTGEAPLGYAKSGTTIDGLIKTRIDYGEDSNNKRPAYYFRHSFYLENEPKEGDKFKLNYKVDDGFRFYINGKDINGFRCGEGCYYSYVTGDWTGDTPDTGTFLIDNADLQLGWNILAVEVHNTSLTSSDILWDCELVHEIYDITDCQKMITNETFILTDELESGSYNITARFKATSATKQEEDGITPIRINEVSAGNDIYINEWGKKNDWVELYNTTSKPIDVAGMYLSDKKSNPQKWQIASRTIQGDEVESENEEANMHSKNNTPPSTIIPAHGTLIIWCDQLESDTQLHAPFKLANEDGATISIQSEDGSWTDCLEYLEQPRWHTFGRFPDGSNYTALMSWPTINRSNLLSSFCYDDILTSIVEEGQIPITPETSTEDIVSRTFYNLQGQQIAQPKGICIEKILYRDGRVKARKVKY